MTVTLAVVTSLDGKLTKHRSADISSWTSREDKQHLAKLINEADVVVMGGNVYKLRRHILDLSQNVKRIVVTHSPGQFHDEAVQDKLEFVSTPPTDLIRELKKRDVKNCLILGGPGIFVPLLEAKLIDYIYQTIEPKIFGQGLSMAELQLDIELNLENHQLLNKSGTLLLKYKVK